jgi:F0F1-type ATP synthase membrane subunit b/b'
MSNVLLALVANERPLINIDITLLLNLGLWFVLFFFLKSTFWGPVMDLIEAREKGTEGARAEAATLEAKAKKLREQVDEKLRGARAEATREREALRQAGTRTEAEVLSTVRTEVNALVETERAALAARKVELRRDVLAAVPALASDIARKALRQGGVS